MRLGALSSVAAVATLFAGSAGAMPIPAYHPESGVTLVAGGCGYGLHRNIYGNCVVNGPGWGGAVVAPGYYGYGAPGYHGGYYHGGGWHAGYYHGGGYHGGGWHGGGCHHGGGWHGGGYHHGGGAHWHGGGHHGRRRTSRGRRPPSLRSVGGRLSRGFRAQASLRAFGRAGLLNGALTVWSPISGTRESKPGTRICEWRTAHRLSS